jgi:hypothetical protein
VPYTWDNKDTYALRVQARNISGVVTDWGTLQARNISGVVTDWGTLEVSMPRNKAINTPFLLFLELHPRMFPILR